MKSYSLEGLVNLTELNKAVKRSQVVFWARIDGYDYVCNGYFAAKVRIPVGATVFGTLTSMFGTIPHGKTMRYARITGPCDTGTDLQAMFDGGREIVAFDTFLTAKTKDVDLHLYAAQEHYIAVDASLADVVDDPVCIWATGSSDRSAVMFERLGERVLILPVAGKQIAPYKSYLRSL